MKRINKKNFFKRGIGITSSPPLNNIIDCLKVNNINQKDLSIRNKIKQFYKEQEIVWTTSATDSLKIIIQSLKNKKGRLPVLGFPSYFCNEVLESIESICIIKFYDSSSPFISIKKELEINKYDAFLLCNYFGESDNRILNKNIRNFFKGTLIYDNAHLLVPNIKLNDKNEFIIMSLYKHYPIREGGCLIYNKKTNLPINNYDSFSFPKLLFINLLNIILDIIFIFKKLTLKYFPYISRIKIISEDPFSAFNKKDKRYENRRRNISLISKFIIESPICNYRKIVKSNLDSRDLIIKLLLWAGISNSDLISKEYGIEINVKDEYIHILKKLNIAGLPIIRWPQLNSNLRQNKSYLENTISLWYQKMYIICNSSINQKKCEIIKRNIVHNSNSNKKIEIHELSSTEYKKINYQSDYSSYLQSESYVKTYSKKYFFYKIKLGRKIIGKFAIAIKHIKHIDTYIINRIKIEQISNSLSDLETEVIYKELNNFLKIKFKKDLKKRLLILLTIEKNHIDNFFINNLKYFFRLNRYKTGIIDLHKGEEELKKNMKGRWRNALKNGLKMGLQIKINYDKKSLYNIFDLYEFEKKKKNYKGIDSSLLKNWYANNNDGSNKLIAFKAYKKIEGKDVFVGAIVICIYEVTATYLLAVNNEKRIKYVSNILLWESIKFARKNGCLFFDLGGIDQIKTPGIASFKLGLNPKLHEDSNLVITLI